jgi:hypothetical protein
MVRISSDRGEGVPVTLGLAGCEHDGALRVLRSIDTDDDPARSFKAPIGNHDHWAMRPCGCTDRERTAVRVVGCRSVAAEHQQLHFL